MKAESTSLDIGDPCVVAGRSVAGQGNQLGVASSELGNALDEVAELGGADGSEVSGVGEENRPAII